MSAQKPSGVVVSKAGPSERGGFHELMANKKTRIIGVCLLVVLLGVGGYLYFKPRSQDSSNDHIITYSPTGVRPVEVQYVQMNDTDLTNKVNYLVGTGQYGDADKLISMQKDLNTDKTKLSLLMMIQQLEGKKPEAAQTAQKLAGLSNLEPGDYEQLGDQAKAAGDKAQAAQYYQKAVDQINAHKQGAYGPDVARLQSKIKEVQQ